MKKRFLYATTIAILIVILSLGLTACNKGSDGRVPVYQGMSISQDLRMATKPMFAAGSGNQHGHNPGEHYGDYEGRNEDLDQDLPFEDDNLPTIEEKVESTLQVIGSADKIYYADKNQDIYITIKLSNPDSYEVMSFTLNGQKYSSYMFEQGSDMENLILKLNVGNGAGIVDYTIDAIKYIDGTDIKDVIMDGDKTVKAGIRASDQIYANVSGEQISLTEINFNANIVDLYSLIEKSDGYAKAVLYDGASLVDSIDLSVGENNIEFNDLTPNKLYQYAIVALYDDLSGNGVQLNTIYKYATYTKAIVLFDNIEIGQTSISFDYLWETGYGNKTIVELELFLDGNKDKDLQATDKIVQDLYSNRDYEIKATYNNINNEEEIISLSFTTQPKTTPSIDIIDITTTQTSLGFAITETDIDEVGEITKIELLHDEQDTIIAESLETRQFIDLLSNNEYTVKVTYVYDLNDGEGDQTIIKEELITTQPKTTPSIDIIDITTTQTSLGFAITETDIDEVGEITKIELLHDEQDTIIAESLETRQFIDLLSNNEYTVKVTYVYDLNDGEGDQTIIKEELITTQPKTTPSIDIIDITTTQTSLGFAITETDIDEVGEITKIELLHDEQDTIIAESLETRQFIDLLSNNEYTVKVTYVYDLNDGEGDQTIIKEELITTQPKTTPSIDIIDITTTQTSLGFAITETDIDEVGEITKIELLHDEQDTIIAESLETRQFIDLLSNNEYTVKVTYVYDLNDGEGDQTLIIEDNKYTNPIYEVTETKTLNTEAVSEGDTIVVNATINNPSNAIATKAIINGQIYNVSNVSTASKIRVEIVVEKQFAGGDTVLTIESIFAVINSKEIEFIFSTNNSAMCFVNGEITVEKIEIIDSNDSLIDFAFPSTITYMLITFSNSTGYAIDSITISGTIYPSLQINVIDSNHIRIPVTLSTGWNIRRVTSLTYSNDSLGSKTKAIDNVDYSIIRFVSNDIIEISTPEDLKNMNGNYYYKLMNDIDLSDIQWDNQGNFYGYFDGNGKVISNMRVVKTFTDQNVNLGLFNNAQGIIKNLTLENTLIMITLNSISGTNYTVICGAIASATNGILFLQNVATIGESSITNNTGTRDYVGGLVGYTNSTLNITNSFNIGVVSGSGNNVGGLVGYSSSRSTITITNSYNSGTVSGAWYVGGLVGEINSNVTITNSYNSGAVSGARYVGGLVGYTSTLNITNSYNTGAVSGEDYVGGLVGYTNSTLNITNSYNSGAVSGAWYVGGLVGEINSNVTITNSYNIGAVSGAWYVGGLVGYSSSSRSTITITNSYNSGAVSGASYVGGLVGYTSTLNITNSYNSGAVSGARYVGGLVGEINSNVTITNSYNSGAVSGASYVGGLVGRASNVTITNSYNSGSINGNSSVGGLVADAYGTITITNSYYLSNQINIYGGTPKDTIVDIIVKVEKIWDKLVWNFINPDQYGNPLLVFFII